MDDPARALQTCVAPDDDSLLIGADFWPRSVDRRTPGLPFWPEGSFGTIALRLSKARDEFQMMADAAAGALKPGGTLYLFGGNGEGIVSAGRRLGEVFAAVETVQTKFHSRVFAARGPRARLKAALSDWRSTFGFHVGEANFSHVTYPGVFASGRLDEGTRFLLETVPAVGGKVLDFACGSGPIAEVLTRRHGDVRFTLSDIDAVSLVAAKENVPGVPAYQIARLRDLPADKFDAIVSNPPIHQGVEQSFAALRDFLATAPDYLATGGEVFLVGQRTVPVAKLAGALKLRKHASDDAFTVWALHR
ncbi:MAG: class I SAM-dependent methyltransferase [Alphaproteobacteria bacterium]|nr:class I SAM-dependent methyltransferase [Alphaproteobacteria bacterium]MBL6940127.1 class I SAM-dependent methyltransferase [Alphaproteobacteria bacterium]MBL7100214.1 class I SAM-dependent methyltransferase [Alphaproteobacteria bacterium]